jgi:hypothetical protein
LPILKSSPGLSNLTIEGGEEMGKEGLEEVGGKELEELAEAKRGGEKSETSPFIEELDWVVPGV